MGSYYGPIITGTTDTVMLLRAFGKHLAYQADNPADRALAGEAISAAAIELPDWALLQTVSAALETYAPPGHYFGAHYECPADFGFWPIDPFHSGDEP